MTNEKKTVRVLLIDDDEFQLRFIQTFLKRIVQIHYEVEWIKTFEEAQKIIFESTYDVILVDYYLDGHHGTEFIRYAIDQGCRIPLILLTSTDDRYLDLEAMDSGAVDFLVKNQINEEILERAIRYGIERKQSEAELEDAKVQLEKVNHHLINLHQVINAELDQARILQQGMVPKRLPNIPDVKIATKYVLMEKIGGDFYDILRVDEDHVGILIADVTGHGIPAALLSFMVSGLFKTFAAHSPSCLFTIEQLNEALYEKMPEGRFVTGFYGHYHVRHQTLSYVSAGHPPVYVMHPDKPEIRTLKNEGLMLGVFPNDRAHFDQGSIQLSPGDKVFLYTDGILEIRNKTQKIYGQKRLQELLLKFNHLPIEELLETTYDEVLKFSQQRVFEDDITLLGLEITENPLV